MAKLEERIRRSRISVTASRSRVVALKPVAAPIDIDALFESTMQRFPKTMARLAE